jgi:hypothetical protein
MCGSPLHLSWRDIRLLRALRITLWDCPGCGEKP